MKVKEITVGLTDVIKIDNYQYVKPELRMVIELRPDVSAEKQIEEAEDFILTQIQKFKDKILTNR